MREREVSGVPVGHREEAGEETRLEAETMSSFGQGGFMVPMGDHPRGEEQKAARCLAWS